ncbi:MAG: GntR family transcriptional regulator [Alphaproteobacteria bacterium]
MRLDIKPPSAQSAQSAGIDRSSPLPLYAQIARKLMAELSGSAADARFYGDEEVSQRFEVSRMTARQAIQQLVDEGFLRRVKGIGTFVSPHKIEERPLASFFEGMASNGRPMSVRILAIGRGISEGVPPDPKLGPDIVYIARLRLLGVVPIVLDHRYLPKRLGGKLKRSDAETRSLVDWIKQSVSLDRVEMQVEAVGADADCAKHLRVLPGEPTLVRHLRYLSKDGDVVMSGRSIYRGDVVRYGFSVPL